MALVDPIKDMTIYRYVPATRTDTFEQYNILYEDGYTDGGFTEYDAAVEMRESLIAAQPDEDRPRGDINNSKIIKRTVTTKVITSRGEWVEA